LKFKDESLTWNTTDPYFTRCFEETALIWGPCGFIIAGAFIDIGFSLRSKRDALPWGFLTLIKTAVCCALSALAIFQLAKVGSYNDEGDSSNKSVDILAPALRLASYVRS
jgi:ATP-binding cassette subfamily C (CFTR/MRP) protein 1